MSPASESRLVEASPPFYAFESVDLSTKMPRQEYMRSQQIQIDGLTESNRDCTHGAFGNAYYQHHEGRYGFRDHGIVSDYICGQHQQSFENSHTSHKYSMHELNYNDIPFSGRCQKEDNLITFTPVQAEAHHRGDIYSNYYHEETQQSHIFNTESYRTLNMCGHKDHNLKIMHSEVFLANQRTDSDNDVIHALSIGDASNDYSERISQKEDEIGAVVSRKSGSVARRNARERKRIKNVNLAFDSLRKRVPQGSKGNKISKVETLRSAIEYIRALQDLVTEKRSGKQRDSDSTTSRIEVDDGRLLLDDDEQDETTDSVVVAHL